jgi:hypothetical protein
MTFFSSFPTIEYKFGDEDTTDLFRNLSIYSTVVDQIKNENSLYQDYQIIENQRPDQVSFILYNNPNFHWTFFLMNDDLREQGWPLSNLELLNFAKRKFPNKVLNTTSSLISFTSFFKTGDTVTGRSSGATATILRRDLDLGKLVISNITGAFVAGENIETSGTTELVDVSSVVDEHLSVHHYENSGVIVDVLSNGVPSPGASDVEKTILDELNSKNDNLRRIRIIKRDKINQVVSSFKKAVGS